MSDKTSVYRWFDADGDLLYVGIAYNPVARTAQHKAEQPWWEEVDHSKVKWYPNRTAAERRAIRTENPKYNKHHSTAGVAGGTTPEWERDRFILELSAMVAVDDLDPDELLTREGVVEILGIHGKTVDRLRDTGTIPVTVIGGQQFFRAGGIAAMWAFKPYKPMQPAA